MNNVYAGVSFLNVFNLVLGVVFGFLLMAMISCAFFSIFLKKYNKNKEIRTISNNVYSENYVKKYKMKDKILSSVLSEVNEVSKVARPNQEKPMYDLSVNEIINGIILIKNRLNKIIKNPLFKDLKDVHISKILSVEETIAKPVTMIFSKKPAKLLYKSIMTAKLILNVFNPVFYIKKLMSLTIFKKGKKDAIIICLDFIGNCCYDIYNNENNLQN